LKKVPTLALMPLVARESAAAWLFAGSPMTSGCATLERTLLSRACVRATSWPTGSKPVAGTVRPSGRITVTLLSREIRRFATRLDQQLLRNSNAGDVLDLRRQRSEGVGPIWPGFAAMRDLRLRTT
jgi:hypothetical protein